MAFPETYKPQKYEQSDAPLTKTEIWDISADFLHTPAFRKEYTRMVAEIIEDKNSHILDTACGTGFPTADLYETGFKDITCVDASKESVNILRSRLGQKGIEISTHVATWQTLNKEFGPEFDALINLDNSLVYMDGWSAVHAMPEGDAPVLERIALVTRNFYDCLKPNGKVIIGLWPPFDPSIKTRDADFGEITYQGRNVKSCMHLEYDWQKRHRLWTAQTWVNGRRDPDISFRSYIISVEELAHVMDTIGFKDIRVSQSSNSVVFDNIVSGVKR